MYNRRYGYGLAAGALLLLVSCSGKPSLKPGAEFRGIDGEPMIRIISDTELEFRDENLRLVCDYTREGDNLRIVITALGTKQSEYLTVVPDGLKRENGDILYRSGRYEEVMKEVLAAREQEKRNDVLFDALGNNNPEAVRAALAEGADPNAVFEPYDESLPLIGPFGDSLPLTALHEAVRTGDLDGIEILLDAGAEIDGLDGSGRTPLIRAASLQNERAVRLLVRRGANRDIKNKDGKTAFDILKSHGSETLQWLENEEEKAARIAGEHKKISAILKSGKALFGQALERRDGTNAVRVDIHGFDEATGRFGGELLYFNSDKDNAVQKFEGDLKESTVRLWSPGSPEDSNWMITLRPKDDEKLVGEYTKNGENLGVSWIDLNDTRNREFESEVNEMLRLKLLNKEARTATKDITKTTSRPRFSTASEVVLTDVGFRGNWGSAEELFFAGISEITRYKNSNDWGIMLKGPSNLGGYFRRDIEFRDDAAECERFFNEIVAAHGAWKTKYAEIFKSDTSR